MICNFCGIDKPLTEYHFMKDKQVYRKKCKTCLNIDQRKYNEKNKGVNLEKAKLYDKYYTLLTNTKEIEDKYKLKRMFYQEPFSYTQKDVVWERLCEKMQ
jgi:hypothetical protein